MNHFDYGSFDSTNADIAFTEANGYTNPASESETRKQLSYPLKEIKDFLHDAISIDGSDNVIQLRVSGGKVQYRTSGNTWTDVSGGIPSGGTTGQVLKKDSSTDYDVSWGSEIPDTETIASGDRIVIYDDSGSKMAKSSVQFGSDTTKYLRNDGTWQTVSTGWKGIDTANKIWTGSINASGVTFDSDGILFIPNNALQVYIDNVKLNSSGGGGCLMIPVKSGTTAKTDSGSSNNGCILFGLK